MVSENLDCVRFVIARNSSPCSVGLLYYRCMIKGHAQTIGLFQKNMALPHNEGWISRLFLGEKRAPDFQGVFFGPKSLLLHRFPEDIHTATLNPYFFLSLVWISRKRKKNCQWNSRVFARVALTYPIWGRAQFIWNSPLLDKCVLIGMVW